MPYPDRSQVPARYGVTVVPNLAPMTRARIESAALRTGLGDKAFAESRQRHWLSRWDCKHAAVRQAVAIDPAPPVA